MNEGARLVRETDTETPAPDTAGACHILNRILIHLSAHPVQWGDWTGCLSKQVPQVFRLFGTSLLGYAVSSFLAAREASFARVRITVQSVCVIYALFTIVILLALALWNLPFIGWLYTVFTGGFAIALNLQYFSTILSK